MMGQDGMMMGDMNDEFNNGYDRFS